MVTCSGMEEVVVMSKPVEGAVVSKLVAEENKQEEEVEASKPGEEVAEIYTCREVVGRSNGGSWQCIA